MAKFRDSRKASTASVACPHRRHESAKDRHLRRLATAAHPTSQKTAGDWCDASGFTFARKNKGEHWIFYRGSCEDKELLAEWWPRTAKFVWRKKWNEGIHCHDVGQVIGEIERLVRKESRKKGTRG